MKRILTILIVLASVFALAFTCEEEDDNNIVLLSEDNDTSFFSITVDTIMDTIHIYMNEDTSYVME